MMNNNNNTGSRQSIPVNYSQCAGMDSVDTI
jgi:hypothetical protein